MSKIKSTQQLQLRQRLVPQQLRLVALVEKNDDEVAEEIAREIEENPALEKVPSSFPAERADHAAAQSGVSAMDMAAEPEQTLSDYLREQLGDLPDSERRLVSYMIGALDSNGYLTRTLPQLITDISLSPVAAPETEIRKAYSTLRSLDPPGVGAQDLRDSLALQLKAQLSDVPDPTLADALEIVKYFFDIYSTRNMKRLAEFSGIPAERILAADKLIRSLNPKPGAAFAADPTREMASAAVAPDFFVEVDGDRLNISMPNSLPQLQIEESFRADEGPADVAEFIRDRRMQALSFIDILKRRQQTLLAIATAIVNIQSAFFLNFDDESKIKPMVLRQVADATGLDLSLISRAVNGKWLATPHGVYSLKSFFNHRTGADDTETSAREIEAVLREIIAAEPKESPLSDEAIAEALKSRGYNVARRTVAKYRTNLGIPPARLRIH